MSSVCPLSALCLSPVCPVYPLSERVIQSVRYVGIELLLQLKNYYVEIFASTQLLPPLSSTQVSFLCHIELSFN